MAQRLAYKAYYDRFSNTKNIPSSTKSDRKKINTSKHPFVQERHARRQRQKVSEAQRRIAPHDLTADNFQNLSNIVQPVDINLRSNAAIPGNVIHVPNLDEGEVNVNLPIPEETLHNDPHSNNNFTKPLAPLKAFSLRKRTIRGRKKRKVQNRRKNDLQKLVCDCTKMTVGEILLMCMQITIKHCLTWIALLDIFKMLNVIFNKTLFPKTKYKLFNLLDANADSLTYHLICKKCNNYLGRNVKLKEKIICSCGFEIKSSEVGSFFIEMDMEKELKKLFSDPQIVNSLDERFRRTKINEDGLEDILDGDVYKECQKDENLLGNPNNFSYTINTDGCKSEDNSKVTVWPIYIMLHELPPRLRKKHMILAGLWVAKNDPPMNIFLKPLVEQANRLSTIGFKWMRNGVEITSKLFPLGCCVDSVARCAILNMKKFNGHNGCTFCEHPSTPVDGVCKYPMTEKPPVQRTDASIKNQMIEAHENDGGQAVYGVWGPSSFMNMLYFNLVKGMIVDFLHACLSGVSNLHMSISLSNSKEKYYIGSPADKKLIDETLLSIKPPTCMSKVPRSIEEKNIWKADEWLNWAAIYSLPCLNNVVKDKKYLNHFAFFVEAMNILLESSITPKMLDEAGELLIKFAAYFQNDFGDEYMYYNVHLLFHLVESVRNWGPLWANSTFPFESKNKEILKMKKCNHQIGRQIVNRLLAYQQVPLLLNEDYVSDRARNFCENIGNHQPQNVTVFEDCMLIGPGKTCTFSEKERQCVSKFFDLTKITDCKRYCRFKYNGYRFTTAQFSKNKKNNDSVFITKNNRFGQIKNIIKFKYEGTEYLKIFATEISVADESVINSSKIKISRMKRCIKICSLQIIGHQTINSPCVVIRSNNKVYINTIVKGALGGVLN